MPPNDYDDNNCLDDQRMKANSNKQGSNCNSNRETNNILNHINENKNFSLMHSYYRNANIYRQNLLLLDDLGADSTNKTRHHDITNLLAAKLFASRGFRRRSYDDQEGDNDINIILQPSDLDDIEKQARVRYAQFRASLQNIDASNPSETASNSRQQIDEPKQQQQQHDAIQSRANRLLFNQRTTTTAGTFNEQSRTTYRNISSSSSSSSNNNNNHHHHIATDTSKQLRALTNIFQDIQLARCLLDQDYNQTVRLFIEKSALNWNFNSFTFDALCCGRSLTELLLHLFDYYNLYNIFSLDIVKVLKCFRLLEFGYHSSNPYHNSVHAADVTQAMHCFIQENKIKKHMTNLEILCSILAAVCHDLDHPGVNQSFLVATNNPLASLYQNNSVLENHHWRFALCIFKESNIFEHFEQSTLDDFKGQLKHLILATDIARQNDYLKRFRDLTQSNQFSMSNTDHRALVLQMALKCADLGNPCRPWLISRVWSNLICDEFYRMGQIERRLGVPLTPICQRDKTSIAGIQTDFFRFIVLPLLELWHAFLQSPLSNVLMSNFDHNYKRWQRANRIVQQLRRRKSVACLEPVEDRGEIGTCPEDSPTCPSSMGSTRPRPIAAVSPATSATTTGDDPTDQSRLRAAVNPAPFFDPTMQTFCSKHSFAAIKRASSDYIKSGNGRLELLRDFQLNRIIEKSPLVSRSDRFAVSSKRADVARYPTPAKTGRRLVVAGDKSSKRASESATQRGTESSPCSSNQPQEPQVAPNFQQQLLYRKALSPIQDRAESGTSPDVDQAGRSPKQQQQRCAQVYQQQQFDEHDESASCSSPASRGSSASSSPVMRRSKSSRTTLTDEHPYQSKTRQQHIKQLYEIRPPLPPCNSKFSISQHPKNLYPLGGAGAGGSAKRRDSDPGCPTHDNYELAAAIVLLQYQNNGLFHKRRSSLPVCMPPPRRSSK